LRLGLDFALSRFIGLIPFEKRNRTGALVRPGQFDMLYEDMTDRLRQVSFIFLSAR
jgi:hypothetical protein